MAAPTVSRTNDNGAPNRVQIVFKGTYTAATDVYSANGITMAAGSIAIQVGFVPSRVYAINATDRLSQEWFSGMNQGDFLETAANGDKTLETDDKLVVAVATTGTAPVTFNPAATVTLLANGGIMTDNDTVIVVIEG